MGSLQLIFFTSESKIQTASNMSEGHVMKMNFNTDLPLGKMLFINWEVDDHSYLAWSCVVLGLVCFAYEGVKTLKTRAPGPRTYSTAIISLPLDSILSSVPYRTRS